MMKKIKKKLNNQGNTFIMVIVSLSFLAILTASLLVAIALCYRLKIMDINSRDNFYYLEQAMDEIYAGVGKDAMDNLNQAYSDTLEVIVYYDTDSKSYVTMDNKVANKVMKKTYMKLVKDKATSKYTTKDAALKRIKSFISNPYDASTNAEGVQCTIANVDLSEKANDNLTILNLELTRTAKYSATGLGQRGKMDSFTQKISTDLVIGEPQFDVSFNTVDASLNDLFSFSMIADKGVDIRNAYSVNIAGDVYAASDFYNKDYNGTTNKTIDAATSELETKLKSKFKDIPDGKTAAQQAQDEVDKYRVKISDKEDEKADGVRETSMYSGIYMSNSNVVITANKLIVPGTIASMNTSSLTVSGIKGNRVGKTDIWADSIVLGGYSLKKKGKTLVGSDVSLNANCYISDDLEVNATGAKVAVIGTYYGYNNSTTDTRSFTTPFLNANGVANGKTWDAEKGGYQTGQAHYNSSAVILNGENATLDLKDVTSMYIAGQSYIEMSKDTEISKEDKDYYYAEKKDTTESDAVASKYNGIEVKKDTEKNVEVKTFTYLSKDTLKDEKGKEMKDSGKKPIMNNYTSTGVKSKQEYDAIQDYKTGEAVSIKSNQLAYIPPTAVKTDDDGSYYIVMPESLWEIEPFNTWSTKDKNNLKESLGYVPVVCTVVSGDKNYFFDFSKIKELKDGKLSPLKMNEFIAGYSKIFTEGSAASKNSNLVDITDYDNFKVKLLKLPTAVNSNDTDYNRIYSNAALTVKSGTTFNIKAKGESIDALLAAADVINQNDAVKSGDETVDESGNPIKARETIEITDSNGNKKSKESWGDGATLAGNVTRNFQNQYREMKLLLTTQSKDSTGVEVAHEMDESAITPINYFFKFSAMDEFSEKNVEQSGYGIWTSKGDVTISNSVGKNIKGMIICMGDVKFDTNVESFEGIIVTGGKIYVDHDMDFIANEEVIKGLLRTCEEHRKENIKYAKILKLFRNYGGNEAQDELTNLDNSESATNISTVQFADILEFSNWKKNVDEVKSTESSSQSSTESNSKSDSKQNN